MVLSRLWELHKNKRSDYGSNEDSFANILASESFGLPAWVGAMIRANDKMFRIQSFVKRGTLKNESLEDSFLDLAGYAIIAYIMYKREQR